MRRVTLNVSWAPETSCSVLVDFCMLWFPCSVRPVLRTCVPLFILFMRGNLWCDSHLGTWNQTIVVHFAMQLDRFLPPWESRVPTLHCQRPISEVACSASSCSTEQFYNMFIFICTKHLRKEITSEIRVLASPAKLHRTLEILCRRATLLTSSCVTSNWLEARHSSMVDVTLTFAN